MHLPRGASVAPAKPRLEPARMLQPRVDGRELVVEQLIVIAEFQKLTNSQTRGSSECRLRAGRRVVDDRGVPRRDDEVVDEVRDAVPKNGVLLLLAERLALAAQHDRDVLTTDPEELLRRHRLLEFVDGVHQVVFAEEGVVRAMQRRTQPVNDRTTGLLGALLDLGALDERLAEPDQLAPRSVEGPRQRQGDHPVIEDAHANAEAIEFANSDGVAPERQRRLVVLDVRAG